MSHIKESVHIGWSLWGCDCLETVQGTAATRPQQSLLCTNTGPARQVLVTRTCSVCEKLSSYVLIISVLFQCILHFIKKVFLNEPRARFCGGQRHRTKEKDRYNLESVPRTGRSVGGLVEFKNLGYRGWLFLDHLCRTSYIKYSHLGWHLKDTCTCTESF